MNQDAHRSIAVVDDDPAFLESFLDLLDSAGLTALTYSSAAEFLNSGMLHSIGCLVSDIRMPGIDGWKLLSIAVAQRPALPVILITAHEDAPAGDMRLLSPDGRQLLFSKPFDAQRLLGAIKHALEVIEE